MPDNLPTIIAPMLAQRGEPFDSPEYLFEIKWDGTRMLAFREHGGYRLVNRHHRDATGRYPEFAFLAGLAPGTVLDGEMVVSREGKPDFALLQARDQSRSPFKIRTLSLAQPATYIVFDLLFENFQSLLQKPLAQRRARLEKWVAAFNQPRLVLSQGIIGAGQALFAETCRQSLEGIMAKKLDSKYLVGRRSSAWVKIKRRLELYCAVIGFVPAGRKDFHSLILAAPEQNHWRVLGQVKSGIDAALRGQLNGWMWTHRQAQPLVPCRLSGQWLEAGLCCRINYLEKTARGLLRFPVIQEVFFPAT